MASTALKRALNKAATKVKDAVIAEFTPATRLVCQIPDHADGRSRNLVVEGKRCGEGSWNLYIETLHPQGGRDIEDLFILPKNTEKVLKAVSSLYQSSGNQDPFYRAEFLSKLREPLLSYLNKTRLEIAPRI